MGMWVFVTEKRILECVDVLEVWYEGYFRMQGDRVATGSSNELRSYYFFFSITSIKSRRR